jgi:RNA polymerase sigma-70 factor, ECF subfamily
VDGDGDIVVMADADRSQWDRSAIERAVELTHVAMRRGRPGPYQLQAAISCLHAVAPSLDETDWNQIVVLHDGLVAMAPSTSAIVNRALAIAERDGPAAGIAALHDADTTWYRTHLALGELYARLGANDLAARHLHIALDGSANETERRHLRRRLAQVSGGES